MNWAGLIKEIGSHKIIVVTLLASSEQGSLVAGEARGGSRGAAGEGRGDQKAWDRR